MEETCHFIAHVLVMARKRNKKQAPIPRGQRGEYVATVKENPHFEAYYKVSLLLKKIRKQGVVAKYCSGRQVGFLYGDFKGAAANHISYLWL